MRHEAEGSTLSLDDAVAYARRARGERKRPSHGWDGLTPTERRVADLALARPVERRHRPAAHRGSRDRQDPPVQRLRKGRRREPHAARRRRSQARHHARGREPDMTTTQLDQAKAEAFAGRMVTVINDAALVALAEHRTPHRPLRHPRGPPAVDERRDRERERMQRAVRPRMARRDGGRPCRRRTTPRPAPTFSPPTRGVADPGGGRGQHRLDRAIRERCSVASKHRSSSASTTVAGFRTRNSPRSTRSSAELTQRHHRRHPAGGRIAARPRTRRTPRSRHRRRRHRVRLGLRPVRDGTRVPQQPLPGLRLLRGSDHGRAHARRANGNSTTSRSRFAT